MIVILDYGMGNPGSIRNMVRKAGGSAVISTDAGEVADATAIILPGVGAFDNGIGRLRSLGLVDLLMAKVVAERTPFLGVCLGMQLLFEKSEEGTSTGLGWLRGDVRRFDFSKIKDRKRLKVPVMGWNLVQPTDFSTLFKGMEKEARFYFVHSYHAVCSDSSDVLSRSTFGYEYTCAVRRDNIFGVQFHAEKSHRFGLTLFRNFLEYAKC